MIDNDGWITSSFSSAQANCVQVKFRKSRRSGNNGCVEVGVAKVSTHTNGSTCVEVEGGTNKVYVRDSKNKTGNGEVLEFSYQEWEEILDATHANEFDWRTFRPLVFDDGERHAFVLGVHDHEFDIVKETV